MSEHKVHKYLRIKTEKNERILFRCVLPNCSHYIMEEFIIGKECICWRCSKVFVILGRMKYRTRPYCELHIKRKEMVEELVPGDAVNELLKKVGVS